MTGSLAYVNGDFIPLEDARVHVADAGFVYGATVSDVLRSFGHRWFRFEDHVRRFLNSCRYVGIPKLPDYRQLDEIAERLRQSIPTDRESGLVLLATPGIVPLYAGLSEDRAHDRAPTVVIHTFPLERGRFRNLYRSGMHVIVAANRQVPPDCWDPKAKCRSRLHWWLAQQQVQALDPSAVPILLDHNGNLTESSAANILLVIDGCVLSPSPEHILWGISLDTTAQLCRKLNIPFSTQPLQLYHARRADEIILTNSLYSIAPVVRLDGRPVGGGTPGPVFSRLYEAWSELVGCPLEDA